MYAYVIYFAWTILYTLTDVPIWSMTATMTRDPQERSRVVAIARIGSIVGVGIAATFVPVLAEIIAPESKSDGYFYAVLIFVGIAIPALSLAFFGVREQVEAKPEKTSLAIQFEWLKTNKPLLLLVVNSVLGFMAVSGGTIMPYYAEYVLNDSSLVGPLIGCTIVGLILGILPSVYLTRFISSVKLNILSAVLRFVLGMIYYFAGYENIPLIFALTFVMGMLAAPVAVLIPVMIGDTIDAMERRTGVRSEALAFATFTFSNKVSTGLAAWVSGLVLGITGYVANQAQTIEAIDGIFTMIALLPALSAILSILPLMFYESSLEKLET